MARLVRFGVSLDEDLSKKFDALLNKRSYASRSEAFRDLIRKELVGEEWKAGKEIVGAITLLYDHHKRELVNKLTDIQHDYQDIIISTQHIHLDHDNCLEIVALKGRPAKASDLADKLRATRWVKHVTLGMSSTGKDIK